MTMKYAHLAPGHLRDETLRTERQNEPSFSENRAQGRAQEPLDLSPLSQNST
jgi:hypothetical protein